MKNFTLFTILAGLLFQAAYGEDIHLKTLEKSMELLEPKSDALNLEKAKDMVVGQNIDVKLAYERVYLAQQNIHQARARYFPYGAGDLTVLYLTNFMNPIIMAELVTSLPSKWYAVKYRRHLRNAETFSLKALKENLKNQMAHMYYGLLKEQAVLTLTGYEIRLYEELIRVLEVQVDNGFATPEYLTNTESIALQVREQYLKLKSYVEEEKAQLKIALNLPYDHEDLVFQPIKKILSGSDLKFDMDFFTANAVEKSYELKAAREIVNAAADNRLAERWSILSFLGLGFNYVERVRQSNSEMNQAVARRGSVENNIKNQTLSRKTVLDNSVGIASSLGNIMENSKAYMLSELADFNVGRTSVEKLIEADIYFIRDFREYLVSHYNTLIKLDDFERAVLDKVITLEEENTDIATEEVDSENQDENPQTNEMALAY